MAIILNGISYRPYHNGPVGEVWVNGIKRWPKQPLPPPPQQDGSGAQAPSDQSNPVQMRGSDN